MKQYQKLNNIIGWVLFAFASMVYILTSEPTASFWDCGEYISTSYKLLVGHPPGAPLFQMLGRLFSLFALGDVTLVARMVNTMSALMSGFTILFLFWSITHIARKIAEKSGEMTETKKWLIFCAGIVGSLAYTFSDSFWFSAVEGEVYASSSFFTAITFWAILKWESVADEKHHMRWIIFIAYLIGLSIGVHMLNLLCIPAIVFVYYFKRYTPTKKGMFFTLIISVILLGIVQGIIIPWTLKLCGYFELFFTNVLGLPFNTGTIIYFLLIIGLIVWGLKYTHKYKKYVVNTAILCITFILIGYSSFLLLVIRSNANTPIDENNPDNSINLLAYLNREQYGDWPILYGPYFNAPYDSENPASDGNPVYTKNEKTGKYEITDERKETIPNYDPRFCTIFPRMWDRSEGHPESYKNWSHFKGEPISVTNPQTGKTETINKPTFGENLTYFFNYQVNWMYLRYFMWNFAGKQNDIQGYGNPTEGNWISGIKFIDEWRLGNQDKLPENVKNKGTNKFYFLPLILGLIGLIYHIKKNYENSIVVGLLFFMTGLAIVLYLNQYPNQPRERDYAYAGSFYAFAIWIGIGIMQIHEWFSKKMNTKVALAIATILGLTVPTVMAKDGWDDHDRSGRYTARDFAANYLNSCAKNAIIFTNGDNDTFPLWYCQEVEGIRTDVRVVNLSLLNTDWYIDQIKKRAYESDPAPIQFTQDQYRQGTRDYVYMIENENLKGYTNLKDLMDFVASDDPNTKYPSQRGNLDYIPTKNFRVPVDKKLVLENGTVCKKDADSIVDNVDWRLDKYGVMKNSLMVLDIIANNNWKRPIYFAITTGGEAYIKLEPYFQLEGLAYRFVPIKARPRDGQTGRVATDIMYDNMMNKFKWGNMEKGNIYLDETTSRMTMNFRNNFARLANALLDEGKKDSAIKVLDRCQEVMPEKIVPYNYFMLPIAEAYYNAGANDKANAIATKLIDTFESQLIYYFKFKGSMANTVDNDKQQALAVMQRISQVLSNYKQEPLAKRSKDIFDKYYKFYIAG